MSASSLNMRQSSEMEDLPEFDRLAHCIKCGSSIPEPVKVEIPPPVAPGVPPKTGTPNPAAKPAPEKEAAAAPPAPGFALPPKPANPTVEYCNGQECPWGEETDGLGEHMHQTCDVCGFEWLSRPMDWKST